MTNQLRPIAELSFRKELNQDDVNVYSKAISKLATSEQDFSSKDMLISGLSAILTSPQFLYLVREGSYSGVKKYNSFEVATKISLALSQTLPDRELWTLAKGDQLASTNQIRLVVNDLLKNNATQDAYASAFLSGWLDINKIFTVDPRKSVYGVNKQEFQPLASDMRLDAIAIFKDSLANQRSINNLVEGSKRYVSRDLARHYNIDVNFSGNEQRKWVDLPADSPYANTGLLTSTLLVSSSLSYRSSVVGRGDTILHSFYCGKTGAPPADAGDIKEDDLANMTQRDFSNQRMSNPNCGGCHGKIDPFGLALNAFDALGRYRANDSKGNPIDTTSKFENVHFTDHTSIKNVLVADDRFKSCFIEINLSYFTSNNIDSSASTNDSCTVKNITRGLASQGDSMTTMIENIITSDFFLLWNDNATLE